MGIAVRDFIPQEEGATPYEEARMARSRMIRTGSNHLDFVADPNDPTPGTVRRDPAAVADAAQAAANKRSLDGEAKDWNVARERLKGWTEAQAIDAMGNMPIRVMEMYLVAEQAGAARSGILSIFPEPDPAMVIQFAPHLADVQKPSGDVVNLTGLEEAIQDLPSAPVDEPSDVTEEQVYETYLCDKCEFNSKSLAGLKAHTRAKHPE